MNTYEYTGITCVVDGKDMTKRATLDGKKLLVKDSYIRGAPLSDSESEEDTEVAQDDEAVAAAEKDTKMALAHPPIPPSPHRSPSASESLPAAWRLPQR